MFNLNSASVETIMRGVNLVVNVGGLIQNLQLHKKELAQERSLHEKSVGLSTEHHEKDLKLSKQTYLLDLFITLEQHFQQLNADLVGSTRESERDMFDQRNQQLQTIILASSVMFSALSTVIVQGFLPDDASEFLMVTYSLTSSLSFAFLFLSIVICIEVTMRASKFMYKRSRRQAENLRSAIENASEVLRVIRKKTMDSESDETQAGPQTSGNYPDKVVDIVSMDDSQVQSKWLKHEEIVHNFLKKREEIIDKAAIQFLECKELPKSDKSFTARNNTSRDIAGRHSIVSTESSFSDQTPPTDPRSFDMFWKAKCRFWSDLATLFFYAGAFMLLMAIMVYMWSSFFMKYFCLIAAVLAVVLIGLAIITGVALGLLMRFTTGDNLIFSAAAGGGVGGEFEPTRMFSFTGYRRGSDPALDTKDC